MTKYYWILGHLSLLPCRLKHSILAKASLGKRRTFSFSYGINACLEVSGKHYFQQLSPIASYGNF